MFVIFLYKALHEQSHKTHSMRLNQEKEENKVSMISETDNSTK